MVLEHAFTFPLKNGMHARPASHFSERVVAFSATLTWTNERNGRVASARSVLALVGTDTRHGDPCRLGAEGEDAEHAIETLRLYLADGFTRCDQDLPAEPREVAAEAVLPRALLNTKPDNVVPGVVVVSGLGVGRLHVLSGLQLPAQLEQEKAENRDAEWQRFCEALDQVRTAYEEELSASSGVAFEVLKAHLSLVNDPAVSDQVREGIQEGRSVGQSLRGVLDFYSDMFARAETAYLRERVLDLEDVFSRLFARLYDQSEAENLAPLTEPTVVLADRLTPSRFLSLDRTQLVGLVLGHAGQTSHTVILARSFGIPTLTAADIAALQIYHGRPGVLDTYIGVLLPDPNNRVQSYYHAEKRYRDSLKARLDESRSLPGCTHDKRQIEVGANISSAEEAVSAFEQGADGIGLFRTELLFADRKTAPSEDEQYEIYSAVVKAAKGRPVIIRTLDIGGDKPVDFLRFPPEKNPFLGYRGARLYRDHRELISAQLRALWRAGSHGSLKVLIPMIATVEEAAYARALHDQAGNSVRESGHSCPDSLPFGLMIEVPSATYQLFELSDVAEFFSLGTNDLSQYFFAADRENEAVSNAYGPFHPAFLRLLKQLVSAAHARRRWIGLCGEFGENPRALALLVGLGLDEISLAAPRIASTKAALRRLRSDACSRLLERALQASTRDAVFAELTAGNASLPMLAPELVAIDLDVSSKEEALHRMSQILEHSGRTAHPAAIENAIWEREDTYSTGFGEGFAVPHCKSEFLQANSIVVARLKNPVEWQSLDGQPVSVVILLLIRPSEDNSVHLKALSRLSRRVVQDEFRETVQTLRDPAALAEYIQQQIGE
ncbi:MAG TPA: phosphoenolpyruvate--protein phosphotransferase [Opitutaceae bacterium]|nr:phosphoenolpyruvate--protein phosphotransferase [Opitutaceae bacterium]